MNGVGLQSITFGVILLSLHALLLLNKQMNNDSNYNNSYYNSEDLDEHMNDFDATTESQSAPPAIPLTEAEAMAQALSLLTIEPNGLALWDFCQDCTDMG